MVKTPRPNGFSLLEIVFVCLLIGIISAIAVPMFANLISEFRVSGDARSVSNAVAVAKMRAASDFSRVRLYVNLNDRSYHIESSDKTSAVCCWITEGGDTFLSAGVNFSYAPVTTSPPNTQGPILQAPLCTDDMGMTIANTACIMFNSRGVPIDSSFAPTGVDALYVTDGQAVFGVTVAATGMLRNWRTLAMVTPSWMLK